MHHAVEPVDVLAQQVGQPLEVLLVGDVELDDRCRLGNRPTIRLVIPSALPKLDTTTCAPCSWATRATAKPIELSIVTPATRIRLPSRMPMLLLR